MLTRSSVLFFRPSIALAASRGGMLTTVLSLLQDNNINEHTRHVAGNTAIGGLFFSTRPLFSASAANQETVLGDLQPVREDGQKERVHEVTADYDEEQNQRAPDEKQQSFDMVEATMQEIHDLVVAMRQHKAMSRPEQVPIYYDEDLPMYNRVEQWELGHKLFAEWLGKLEQLLTKDIMQALCSSAEYVTRDPSLVAAREAAASLEKSKNKSGDGGDDDEEEQEKDSKHDPTSHQGFRRHPLHCPSATGEMRVIKKELPSHQHQKFLRRINNRLSRFHTHAPYQVQVARPDASAELMALTRCRRDRHTLECLVDLARLNDKPREKRLPTDDVMRIVKLVSDSLGY